MIPFAGSGILLDIEGTVSPLSYVKEVLFPYAREHLSAFLDKNWNVPEVQQARRLIARDAGTPDLADTPAQLKAEVTRQMNGDVKATGLKELQGLIWQEGYAAGRLKSKIFPDVPLALSRWEARGISVRIYSSGSVTAQKSFFRCTELGDLSSLLKGYYDTTIGGKKEAGSYTKIAQEMQLPPGEILFISDIVAELDAARQSGLQTALALRPGNLPVGVHAHPTLSFFDQIAVNTVV